MFVQIAGGIEKFIKIFLDRIEIIAWKKINCQNCHWKELKLWDQNEPQGLLHSFTFRNLNYLFQFSLVNTSIENPDQDISPNQIKGTKKSLQNV